MNRRTLSRSATLAVAVGTVALASCSKDPKPRGEIMLAISADMSIPKNMNQVTVEVLDEGGHKVLQTYPIRPESLGQPMPGTLGILPPDSGGQLVRIRLRAERDTGLGQPLVRVVREALLKIPTDRVAMLTMPLRWLCDGSVVKLDDGSYSSDCGKDETCAAGICVKAAVDSAKLPSYDPAKVFGGGNDQGAGGECMDVQGCFTRGSMVTPDPTSCTIALPTGADQGSLNVAVVLTDDGTSTDGHCVSGRCYIPLDRDPVEGWGVRGSAIQLPAAVCKRLSDGKIQGVSLTEACKTKDLTVPICGPWTNVKQIAQVGGTPPDTVDAGAGVDGGTAHETDGGGVGRPDTGVPTCASGSVSSAVFLAGNGGTDQPFDIELIVDQSASMTAPLGATTWWAALQSALTAFVSDSASAGIGVGIQYFPLGGVAPTSCTADYGTPDVEIGPLPGNAPAIIASLTSHTPTGFTPTGPALQGAIGHAQAWAAAHSSNTAVVLITDGYPTECTPPDVPGLQQLTSNAKSTGISTFVIGWNDTGLDMLSQVAVAGGTTAYMIAGAEEAAVASDAATALNAIRAAGTTTVTTASCGVALPAPPGVDVIDPTKISMRFKSGEQIPALSQGSDCAANGDVGWHFDDAANPSSIGLCSSTCTRATTDVPEIVYGCSAPVVAGGRDASAHPAPNCGNRAVDPGEQCDGADLNGATCASATSGAAPTGVLQCGVGCTFDTTGCTSSDPGCPATEPVASTACSLDGINCPYGTVQCTCKGTWSCGTGCVTSLDCTPSGKVCDTANQICVQCNGDPDCATSFHCEPLTKTCVQCLTTADCGTGTCNLTSHTCG